MFGCGSGWRGETEVKGTARDPSSLRREFLKRRRKRGETKEEGMTLSGLPSRGWWGGSGRRGFRFFDEGIRTKLGAGWWTQGIECFGKEGGRFGAYRWNQRRL